MDRKRHWEEVYTEKSPQETSWYQQLPAPSLAMIRHVTGDDRPSLIDVGGGASRLVDCLLAEGFQDLTVLDISARALEHARARLGPCAADVAWIEADVTQFEPDRTWEIWHDRAAFHFLIDAADRARYVAVLRRALAAGGHAIIGAFALDGPSRCSGLEIVRYDASKLGAELGPGFSLEEERADRHQTPAGREQRFGFYRFRRIRGAPVVRRSNPGYHASRADAQTSRQKTKPRLKTDKFMQCSSSLPADRSNQNAVLDEVNVNPRRMAAAAAKACELMKTLGHKDRLMVLCHLSGGEKSVGELATLLDIPQSPLSQHLARMRKESLVKTRREAQTIFYSIASEEAARIVALMHELYCSD